MTLTSDRSPARTDALEPPAGGGGGPPLRPDGRAGGELPRVQVPHGEGEKVRRDRRRHLEDVHRLAALARLTPERTGGHERAQVRGHDESRAESDADARRVLQRSDRPRVDRLALTVQERLLPTGGL